MCIKLNAFWLQLKSMCSTISLSLSAITRETWLSKLSTCLLLSLAHDGLQLNCMVYRCCLVDIYIWGLIGFSKIAKLRGWNVIGAARSVCVVSESFLKAVFGGLCVCVCVNWLMLIYIIIFSICTHYGIERR